MDRRQTVTGFLVTIKDFLGFLSIALTLVGYVPYFHSIFKKRTKPHLFSWIIWGTVNAIAFAGQWSHGGGAGSWAAGFTALLSFGVVGLSTVWGEKNITKSDVVAFTGALAAIALWYFTNDPLGAVCLATFIDILGCYPTIRKSYNKPHEEPLFSWVICSLRSVLSLFALGQYSLVTTIYPIAMIFTNGGLALMLFWRRAILKGTHNG